MYTREQLEKYPYFAELLKDEPDASALLYFLAKMIAARIRIDGEALE